MTLAEPKIDLTVLDPETAIFKEYDSPSSGTATIADYLNFIIIDTVLPPPLEPKELTYERAMIVTMLGLHTRPVTNPLGELVTGIPISTNALRQIENDEGLMEQIRAAYKRLIITLYLGALLETLDQHPELDRAIRTALESQIPPIFEGENTPIYQYNIYSPAVSEAIDLLFRTIQSRNQHPNEFREGLGWYVPMFPYEYAQIMEKAVYGNQEIGIVE
jgi:hypothetical protein